jgi:hypothetical protein
MKRKARLKQPVASPKARKPAAGPKRRGAPKALRIPITNIHSGSDYTARILVGSQQVAANVILDTGSSTLAVVPSIYKAAEDTDMGPSSLAQRVKYGSGEWLGPVVKTSLVLGNPAGEAASLKRAPIAITVSHSKGDFTGVDGIMGLAFRSLNDAVDLRRHLTKQKVSPPVTYPWPFEAVDFATRWKHFAELVAGRDALHASVEPYFTELASQGLAINKFAFYTLRSWARVASRQPAAIAGDPRNHGYFVLGGGEEQKNLYSGTFKKAAVVHDVYYNTDLLAVQVEGCQPIKAARLQGRFRAGSVSNSIVDSGTNVLVLANEVCQGVIESLAKLNPQFIRLIQLAGQGSVPSSAVKLTEWPRLNFFLKGTDGKPVKLTCTPETYWQDHHPAPGRSVFQIRPAGNPVNQSILGLPLMNNYYTVFDRSPGAGKGVIKFATIKRS